MTRACVFTIDLGDVAAREDAILDEIAALTGRRSFDNVSFVGLRNLAAALPAPAYQPFIAPREYGRARVGHALLRVAGRAMMPAALARAGLSICSPSLVEAITACDPDVVLLDVPWARHLKRLLAAEFPGRVVARGESERHGALASAALDPDVKVSVVLPTFNGVKYLRQSIQSCLDQTHRNLELIIVDDGSKEDIGGVVAGFTDARITFVRHETNQGLPRSLNTGFRMATGQYLTWTSDDNYYVPHAIERMTSFLTRHPGIGFVYSAMYVVEEHTGRAPWVRQALPQSELREQNGVGGCFLYRRVVQEKVGEYAPKAILVEDYDYWVRVSGHFRMQRLIEPLYYYRYHDSSLTSTHGSDAIAERFDMVREHNGLAATR